MIASLLVVGCEAEPTPAEDAGLDAASQDASATDSGRRDARPAVDAYGCPDDDGDGHPSSDCGGGDCDDADDQRYPGRAEICDAAGHDEDCDDTTFGGRDEDDDGYVSNACCNGSSCGDDCNDAEPAAHPTEAESCDGIDNDCDTRTDESVSVPLYLDMDEDGYGTGTSAPGCSGTPRTATVAGDCDDTRADTSPSDADTCNGRDDDCDGLTDDVINGTVVCRAGQTQACRTSCGRDGEQACSATCLGWGTCTSAEVCNGCDDDDDGADDEDFACIRGASSACTNACGTAGTQLCDTSCSLAACLAPEACNYCDDDGDGNFHEEKPNASVDLVASISGCTGGATPMYGTGTSCGTTPTPQGFELWAEILDGTAVPQAGAYWFEPGSLVQGWGPTEIEVDLEVTAISANAANAEIPLGGWAIVLARGASGVGDAANAGIPSTPLDGVAARWHWSNFDSCYYPRRPPSNDDTVRGYELQGGGGIALRKLASSPDSTCFSGDGLEGGANDFDGPGGPIVQRMRLRYTPDDPTTPGDEEQIRILAGTPGQGGTLTYDYVPTDAIPVGTAPLRVGITAGTFTRSGFDDVDPPGLVFGVPVRARVKVMVHENNCCSPPDITFPLTVSRTDLCP